MTKPAMKLDTLSYAKKLIAAGCDRKLAEAHAEAQQDTWFEVSEDYLSQFVTKEDLHRELSGINNKISGIRKEIDMIRKEMDVLSLKLTTRLGGIMVAGITILAILIKF